MTDPAKYWPGGIPDDIRCDPEPFEGDIGEEMKGWQLFLEETAIGRDEVSDTEEVDENFGVTQRRRLVTQWARMSQEKRDSYQSRAPFRPPFNLIRWYPREKLADPRCGWSDKIAWEPSMVCITATAATAAAAEEGSPPLSPRDAALWAKQRILGYGLGSHRAGENFLTLHDAEHGVGVAVPNAADDEHTTVTPHNFLRWSQLEAADFDRMFMTPRGTVLFTGNWGILFVDREALDKGPALLCALENNGAVSISHRVWAFTLKSEWYPDRNDAERILQENHLISRVGYAYKANMEKGILEFLDEFQRFIGGEPELWRYLIERCAPGYLEVEEAGRGMAYGYDHSRFRTQAELCELREPGGLPMSYEMMELLCKPAGGLCKSLREAREKGLI
ncbi:hypothetical protein PG996_007418 [Apiospora saccharicola]|uniref:Uncharacterized protein n=1 Tax=Apiospora saccharicola TaxID=335842 RepID=A0ABR1VAU0_9PEZI